MLLCSRFRLLVKNLAENINLYEYENKIWELGYNYIVGLDEAGRGPMAGPLVVGAVVLDKNKQIEGLNDSKQLSKKKREALYEEIIEKAISYRVEFIFEEELDKLNIYQASKQGMIRAYNNIDVEVDYLLSDAIDLNQDVKSEAIIKGDSISASIAAASILAKVSRDRYMVEMAKVYPEYGFERHKGYVTKLHLEKLFKYGPCDIHRRSFEPVRRAIYAQLKLDI